MILTKKKLEGILAEEMKVEIELSQVSDFFDFGDIWGGNAKLQPCDVIAAFIKKFKELDDRLKKLEK